MERNALWPILVLWIFLEKGDCQCSKQDYQRCVKLADPLLKDPHLIYPDNPRDIEHVCRTWTYFVDCVKQYTDRCFTESRRKEFNKAVESPVSSIHKLCSSPDYRSEYMEHAECMKMMLIDDKHCGRHYRLLVNQVSGEAAQSSICCSHHMFRECVVDQTRSTCKPDAVPFSGQMLDKALSFLREQCTNYNPNQADCPGVEFYKSSTTLGRSDDSTSDVNKMKTQSTVQAQVTPSSELPRTSQTQPQTKLTNPWTPATETRGNIHVLSSTEATPTREVSGSYQDNRISSSRPIDNAIDETIPQSLDFGSDNRSTVFGTTGTTNTKVEWTGSSVAWTPSINTEPETSRSSYARGIIYSASSTEATPTWKVSGSYQNTWLPSPRPIDNAIDEPNQQGLGSGSDNSATLFGLSMTLLLACLFKLLIVR